MTRLLVVAVMLVIVAALPDVATAEDPLLLTFEEPRRPPMLTFEGGFSSGVESWPVYVGAYGSVLISMGLSRSAETSDADLSVFLSAGNQWRNGWPRRRGAALFNLGVSVPLLPGIDDPIARPVARFSSVWLHGNHYWAAGVGLYAGGRYGGVMTVDILTDNLQSHPILNVGAYIRFR